MMKNKASTFAELIERLQDKKLQILFKKLTKWNFNNISISSEEEDILLTKI